MIKKIIKTGLYFPITLIKKHKAKKEIPKLKFHDSPKLRAVGNALEEALTDLKDNDERNAHALIEKRRAFLLNSRDKIPIIDYGAGKPNSNRTKEEMEKGVPSEAEVSNICKASKPEFWAIILFKLIRKLQPSSCIELGSCVGISAAYQGVALSLNNRGSLTSLEGSPEIANIATETIEALNLTNTSIVVGPFQQKLIDVLESSKPVDFFFNDGHHNHDAVIEYFNTAMPYLAVDAIVVFDDISWSPGMNEAWRKIENDNRVAASIDLGSVGIALIGDGLTKKEKFKMPL